MIDREKEDEREHLVISEQISAEQTKRYYCICLIKHCEKKADILICLKYRSAAAAEEEGLQSALPWGISQKKDKHQQQQQQ